MVVCVGIRRQNCLTVPFLFVVAFTFLDDFTTLNRFKPLEVLFPVFIKLLTNFKHSLTDLLLYGFAVLAILEIFLSWYPNIWRQLVLEVPRLLVSILTMKLFKPVFLVLNEFVHRLDHLRLSDLILDFCILATFTNLSVIILFIHEGFKVSVKVFLSIKDGFEVLS